MQATLTQRGRTGLVPRLLAFGFVVLLATACGWSRADPASVTWRPFGPNAMGSIPGLPLASSSTNPAVFAFAQADDNVWLGRRVSLLMSFDGGETWRHRTDLPTRDGQVYGAALSGEYSYALVEAVLYGSAVGTESWELVADLSTASSPPYLLGVEPVKGVSLGLARPLGSFNFGPPAMIEISDDAGASWRVVAAPVVPNGGAIDWNAPGAATSYRSIHVFASGVGVLYTFDPADHAWRAGPFFTVSVAASNGRAIAAAETRLLHSPDAGRSWQVAKVDGADFRAGVVAYAPANPLVAYAVEQASDASIGSCRVARSADGGTTWAHVGLVECWPHSLSLAVGAGSGDTLVLFVQGLHRSAMYRSTNGGRKWSVVRRADGMPNGYIDGVSFDAVDATTLWLGSGPRVPDRTADLGVNWTSTAPIGDWGVKVIGASKSVGGLVFGLAPCIDPVTNTGVVELVRSLDGGRHWMPVSAVTCGWIAEERGLFDGESTAELYFAALGAPPGTYPLQTILFRSVDHGASWALVSSAIPQAQFIVRAPGDPMVLFLGAYSGEQGGLMRSSDRGKTWQPVSLGARAGPVSAFAIASSNARAMYVAVDRDDVPRLLRSDNAGVSWTPVWEGMPNARINAIAVDPGDSNRVYAGVPDFGVFRSDDAGATWTSVSSGLTDLRVLRLEFHRHDPALLYALTDTGAYVMNVTGIDAGSREAIEFHHAGLDHYFVTADPAEVAALDRGAFDGWTRTGEAFRVIGAFAIGGQPVCRYFGVGFAPLSSHFYSPYRNECDLLATDPRWLYETEAFGLVLPEGTARGCPRGMRSLYRAWNAGQGGAPNHRYTTSATTLDAMIGRGWIFEGQGETRIFACVPH